MVGDTDNDLSANLVESVSMTDNERSKEQRKSEFSADGQEDVSANLSTSFRIALGFIRFIAIFFSNLKLTYIALQMAQLTDINNTIEATGVDSNCDWFWGPYTNTYDYDDDIGLTEGNSNSKYFKMTCVEGYCPAVCPGDCDTKFFYGTSSNESAIDNTQLSTCTITFRYFNATFILILVALIFDALLQFVIGSHMAYVYFFPNKGNWFFLKNLHQRSIYVVLLYALRPGMLHNFLTHPALEIYPSLPNVTRVPFWYFIAFSLAVDAPYVAGSLLWALFDGGSFSIYLTVASILNIGASFMFMYFLQLRDDLRTGKWRI